MIVMMINILSKQASTLAKMPHSVRLTRFRKLQKSFDLSIIQGCYYNCTLIASLSQDIFGIFYRYSTLQPLAYTTLDDRYQIC